MCFFSFMCFLWPIPDLLGEATPHRPLNNGLGWVLS